MPNNQEMTLGLWKAYVEGITKSPGASKNVIALGGVIPSVFEQSIDIALAQAYQLGGFIPAWTLLNPDSNINQVSPLLSTNDLFHQYGIFLDSIVPSGSPTQNEIAQIQNLQTQIKDFKDQRVSDELAAYKEWQQLAVLPDSPTWEDFRSQEPWATKLADDETAILGPQAQLDKLLTQAYGPGYQTIEQAKTDYQSARSNPQFQMKIAADGSSISVPRYLVGDGGSLDAYKQWLAETKDHALHNVNPAVYITFSQDDYTQNSSYNSFAAGGVIPLDDFFWVGVSGSETHQTLDMSQSTFKGTISYQDVTVVPIQPDPQWYNGALVEDANVSISSTSPYANTTFWGPKGKFNLIVTSILVGYAPKVEFHVSNWGSSDVKDAWSASVKIGWGPFTLGSASDQGKSEEYKYDKTDSSLSIWDPTDQAKVIGLVVEILRPSEL